MSKLDLIFDCGATSAKVAIIGPEIAYEILQGFNPNHHDWMEFRLRLEALKVNLSRPVDSLKFYGAGLSSIGLCNQMQRLLNEVFELPEKNIEVYSDMMACAHAAYQGKAVIIGILGTGSNVGYYDGRSFTRETPSLGYLLGDEGSGVDIGRRILKDYLYGALPAYADAYVDENFELSIDRVLDETYTRHNFRSIASGLSLVASHFHEKQHFIELVRDSFASYIEVRLRPELKAHTNAEEVVIFGSIANVFTKELRSQIQNLTTVPLSIVSSPIEMLVEKK